MLHEFIATQSQSIIARAKERVTVRTWPPVSPDELQKGLPIFLTQLSDTLEAQLAGRDHSSAAMSATATQHGPELLALGFSVSQVVHDYGDICQAITELAIEQDAPITTDEFKTLNGCLDTAIAEAVTEHTRLSVESRATEETERCGHATHETRDLLNTAMFAFYSLKEGTVAINGSTGALLGRSLMGLRNIVESSLSDIRIKSNQQRPERVSVTPFLNDIAVAGRLHANSRGQQFVLEPGDPAWVINADPQVVAAAVMNLVDNACKYSRPGGTVVLRAAVHNDKRLFIEVQDECGGLREGKGELIAWLGGLRGDDRSGLGLGLSMARKGIRANGGDIHTRNMPGRGCVFVIDLPLA